MGCCASSEKGGGESKETAEKQSQIAPTYSPTASEMSMLETTKGALYTEFTPRHGPSTRCPPFTYTQLYEATEGFRPDHFLGEGGFGQVYKGVLHGTKQEVAIKILNPEGTQGDKEFCTEVLMLSRLSHPNLVKLVGYCVDSDQRLLVYEYMPLGSLTDHLHDLVDQNLVLLYPDLPPPPPPPPDKKPLDWNTRMKILAGAAKGLQHLHVKANPPVINHDMKCENILLGEGYHPKLSDFGLAKLGPTGDQTHVSTVVMGTPGYCAPEYLVSGQLTLKSDIYSFGVVILEVITGRKAIDHSRPRAERNLAEWATPLINQKDFQKLADPALGNQYNMTLLFRALSIAQWCVNKTASKRPQITEVADALTQISELQSRRDRQSAASSSPAQSWEKTGTRS